MHVVLISGSHRQVSQSARVAGYLASRLPEVEAGTTTDIIELAGNPLPLWDESGWQPGSPLLQQWQPYAERLRKADGLVMIAPEWHGMVPAGLKNFFIFCTAQDVGHKAALIVTVSSSRGGAYPVDELRISSYKNNRLCYIPEHLIVRDAEKMFVGNTPADKEDAYLRDRADFALRNLMAYSKALTAMRASVDLSDKRYPFGM